MQNSWLSWVAAAGLLASAWSGLAAEEPSPAPDEDVSMAARLERQVRYLSAALAAARCELDAAQARAEGRALAASPEDGLAGVMADGARVRDVNRDLGLVVADAGSRQGVRAGLALMVMRGEQSLARVRVVDVRRRLAGAVIEELLPGAPYPGRGDRLVVVTDGE